MMLHMSLWMFGNDSISMSVGVEDASNFVLHNAAVVFKASGKSRKCIVGERGEENIHEQTNASLCECNLC
jgi:hypothetical protein